MGSPFLKAMLPWRMSPPLAEDIKKGPALAQAPVIAIIPLQNGKRALSDT